MTPLLFILPGIKTRHATRHRRLLVSIRLLLAPRSLNNTAVWQAPLVIAWLSSVLRRRITAMAVILTTPYVNDTLVRRYRHGIENGTATFADDVNH